MEEFEKDGNTVGMCNISDAYSVCIGYQNIIFNCLALRCSLSVWQWGLIDHTSCLLPFPAVASHRVKCNRALYSN